MIYKDKRAQDDREDMPGNRDYEDCLNCPRDWWGHDGWACRGRIQGSGRFSQQPPHHRYLTKSMKDSIVATPAQKFNVGDRVKVNANNWGGATGTVVPDDIGAFNSPSYVCVRFDQDCHHYNNTKDYHGFRLEEVEMLGATSQVSHSQPAAQQVKDDHQKLMDFFRATQPGQCACGLVKEQCNYHRP